MIQLPRANPDPNLEAVARYERERFTGLTSTTITLAHPANEGTERVEQNGVGLDPSTAYTIAGSTITLASAAVAGDVFVIWYHARRR